MSAGRVLTLVPEPERPKVRTAATRTAATRRREARDAWLAGLPETTVTLAVEQADGVIERITREGDTLTVHNRPAWTWVERKGEWTMRPITGRRSTRVVVREHLLAAGKR